MMQPETFDCHYHAHIYFDKETRDTGWALREEIDQKFSTASVGHFHEQCVGPHPRWSFQVSFGQNLFGEITSWLMFNRKELAILVHPDTGEHLKDHRDSPLWMGEILPLKLEIFQ